MKLYAKLENLYLKRQYKIVFTKKTFKIQTRIHEIDFKAIYVRTIFLFGWMRNPSSFVRIVDEKCFITFF